MHESKADALAAFNEAKFGMFIHWGLYAIPGGVWKGERMEEGGVGPTVSEWVMRRKSIPRAEYTQLAQRFNPLRFDADQWADIAADAGMRYMVITAKHHDGFALYDSKVSKFDVVDATPFRRDVIQELHDACSRRNVRFGVYYSHGLDWNDGGGFAGKHKEGDPGLLKISSNDWDPSPRSFDDYLHNKALPQVEELVRRHPDLFLVWFDAGGYLTEADSMEFYRTIFRHAPQTLVQSRISSHLLSRNLGDYQSAEGQPRARSSGDGDVVLGNLRDHEQLLGIQELRPRLEITAGGALLARGRGQPGRQLPAERRADGRGRHSR